MEKSTEQVKKAPNPTGKGGFQDHPEFINPGGRPKNSLKSYVAKKLAAMSVEEKEEFLKTIGNSLEIWKMGEGAPRQGHTGEDEEGNPIPLLGGDSNK